MDSLTQAALGAAIGEGFFGKKIGNKAAAVGAMVATIPDLDVIFLPLFSSVDRLGIHRGFSHSIVFSIIGAVVFTYLYRRFKWSEGISKTKVFAFMWIVLFTHMLLDAFTTYGTQLFLPFSDYRVGFDSINVVDPMYTVPLLLGLLGSLWLYRNSDRRQMFNTAGIVLSTTYLLATLGVKQMVAQTFEATLQKEEITYEKLLTVPVGLSSINWYGVAKTKDGIYIGKHSNWTNNPISLTYFPTNDSLLLTIEPELADRLKWLAQDFYTVASDSSGIRFYNLQCDMQGIQDLGEEKAPTAFYFGVKNIEGGKSVLSVNMHEAMPQ